MQKGTQQRRFELPNTRSINSSNCPGGELYYREVQAFTAEDSHPFSAFMRRQRTSCGLRAETGAPNGFLLHMCKVIDRINAHTKPADGKIMTLSTVLLLFPLL